MLKDYFGIGRGTPSTITPWFIALFITVLIPMTGLWLFFRWIFTHDGSLFAVICISLVTSWIIAYLIGYSQDSHTGE
ncbi:MULTISPECIES: hypothetical protein [unclassified Rothia (in: high G+C Gram-positive bacteria)]|uniref:hypothetical protein n=1 Tax=unclassified Rothia (in: high G+C Gram-positive bacteria) TaxID=2689056 RepID=UPI00195E50A5|nr:MULTISPECIES: hypothetical protein [unclassified Rothia (in: high G+C Gram-positive bacteria)]MBM7051552.1 hypothetical protein [Rothia sp. ZJ1223]QRZ61856.1 hypothetical protein JR346_01570 [Rothia sp. ZJ932]